MKTLSIPSRSLNNQSSITPRNPWKTPTPLFARFSCATQKPQTSRVQHTSPCSQGWSSAALRSTHLWGVPRVPVVPKLMLQSLQLLAKRHTFHWAMLRQLILPQVVTC